MAWVVVCEEPEFGRYSRHVFWSSLAAVPLHFEFHSLFSV